MADDDSIRGSLRGTAGRLQHVQQTVWAQNRIEAGLGDLAGNGNSTADVFLNKQRDLRIVENTVLPQLALNGSFGFATREPADVHTTDQRHRDAPTHADPSVFRKIRGAIDRNL